MREGFIEILRVPGNELVTAIELMSPRTKHGAGIGIHEERRSRFVNNGIHFVELDLLRGGARSKLTASVSEKDYYALIFRADRGGEVHVFPWTIRETLPTIPIPLSTSDKDVPLNLEPAVHDAYERGRYDRKLRYTHPLRPPLKSADAIWAQELIRAAGFGDSACRSEPYPTYIVTRSSTR